MKTKTTAKKSAAKTTKPVAAKPSAKAQATKPSKFSSRKLFPSPAVKKANPRRAESHGFRSLEIIRKEPGITYEAFLRAGGRHRDLNWDAARKRVEAKA